MMRTNVEHKGHPRLYFSNDDILSIKENIKEGIPKEIWNGLYKIAKETDISEIYEDEGGMEELPEKVRNILGDFTRPKFISAVYNISIVGFVWAVTSDDQFAEKGKKWLVQAARAVKPKPRMDGWKVSCDEYICMNLAEGYDWLYGCLSEEERLTVRQSITENYISCVYQSLRSYGSGATGNHADKWFAMWDGIKKENRYCNARLGTLLGGMGVATLSILGEVPYEDETREWLELFKEWLRGYVNAIGRDGDWSQGISYGFMGHDNVYRFMRALKLITGENWTEDQRVKHVPYFYLYSLMSGGKGLVNFGDAEYVNILPSTRVLLPLSDNPYGRWCYQNLKRIKPMHYKWDFFLSDSPLELIWYNGNIEAKPPDDLPLSRHFRDMGLVVLRTGWKEDALCFAIRSSTPIGGHSHIDFNSFILDAYGERLVIDPGRGPYSYTRHESVNYYYHAWGHNAIAVNENELTPYGIHDYYKGKIEELGKIQTFLSTPAYDYILADASSVFRGVLRENLRHVLFLRPDYFVIYDEIVGENDKIILDWLLHSIKGTEITVEGDNICLDRKKASLHVKVILPEKFNHTIEYGWTADEHWGEPVKEDPYIEIRPAQDNKETKFLMVLYPLNKERGDKLPLITKIYGEGRAGIKVERGQSMDLIITGKNIHPIEGVLTDANIAIVSKGSDNKVERCALHEGMSLTYGRTPFISVDKSTNIVLYYKVGKIVGGVQLTERSNVQLYSAGKPNRVLVNKRTVDYRYNSDMSMVELNLKQGFQQLEICMTED